MGFESYAAYQLDAFSLALRPAAVAAFLERLASDITPKCLQEAGDLAALKRQHLDGNAGVVQPWDRQWLQAAARGGDAARALATLPDYFELEGVVQGLSRLLCASMGMALAEAPLAPGEGWAQGVRKFEALHETGGDGSGRAGGGGGRAGGQALGVRCGILGSTSQTAPPTPPHTLTQTASWAPSIWTCTAGRTSSPPPPTSLCAAAGACPTAATRWGG